MKLDYWMYGIIREVLRKEATIEGGKYTEEGRDIFKENRWDKYGQLNLCEKRLREMHEEHDKQAKEDMGIRT